MIWEMFAEEYAPAVTAERALPPAVVVVPGQQLVLIEEEPAEVLRPP